MLLNTHISEYHDLIVDGKQFDNVRGIKGFYLPVPKLNSIIFVTDEKDYSITFHVYNLGTRQDIPIRSPSSLFGRTIGLPPPKESVDVDAHGNIVLITDTGATDYPTKEIVVLDLSRKAVVKKGLLYFDGAGNSMGEHDYQPPQ
jgi:hypothetical protein